MDNIPFYTVSKTPASLYIHVPYCARKCAYCAFHSTARNADANIFSIAKDAAILKELCSGGDKIKIKTVYIGGGTPTILEPKEWIDMGNAIKNSFELERDAEFTVEANPESLRDFHIDMWKDIGVTRISLGVQSLIDDELRFLGRGHSADDALKALKMLIDKFDVSADLIFGLPSQTLRGWDFSLSSLLNEGIKHISAYQLSVEKGTKLWKEQPSLPDGYPFYRFAQWLLPRKGLIQYEIASFAEEGYECKHNLGYWRRENVIAIGPSSWGYVDGVRYKNSIDGAIEFTERLNESDAAAESAILLLRTKYGIECDEFISKHGKEALRRIFDKLKDVPPDCVSLSADRIALTKRGMRIANSIWSLLL